MKGIGATAWQYGLRSCPLVVGIDKNGKVAFRGDPQGWSPKPAAADKDEKPEPNRILTEESMNQSFKKELARQIERILDRKD